MRKTFITAFLVLTMVLVPVAAFAGKSVSANHSYVQSAPVQETPVWSNVAPAKTAAATYEQSVVSNALTPAAVRIAADGSQTLVQADGTLVRSNWAVVPNAAGKAVWKYYDANGKMLMNTWVWVKGKDGKQRCYYLGPDGTCFLNGVTPDGYTVDANGAWYTGGIVRTR